MALQKSIDTNFRYPATYWRIVSVSRVNAGLDSPVSITLAGYKDAAARNDGASALSGRSYSATASLFDEIQAENLVAAAYEWLKANEGDFSGAADV
jgi:hypothetical protein